MRSRPGRKPAATDKTPETSGLARDLEWRVRLSFLALVGERVWEALLWPFLVVAAFLVIALLDGFSLLPALAHRIVLGAFGIALLASLLPLLRITLPTRVEALRRLERHAEVKHRPASSYEDQLGAPVTKETAFLWATHRERLSRLIAKLKPRMPEPRTDRKDPYAVRAALLLCLIAAFLAAGASGWDRLLRAFTPGAVAGPSLLRLDAWVTPPVYTGMPPIVLADGSDSAGEGAETFRAMSVPERSDLIVRAHAPGGEAVSLVTANAEGTETKSIEPKKKGKDDLIEFQVPVMTPSSAEVTVDGHTVAKWRFDLIDDHSPRIALLSNPNQTPRGALRLVFSAEDDYGVASAEGRFELVDGQDPGALAKPAADAGEAAKDDPLLQPPTMPLQLPRSNAKRVEGTSSQDLTAHPWAGLQVRMTLIARDQAGQTGASEPYVFALPERKFTKPLAKAVIEQRKKLVREPDNAADVAAALDALTIGDEKVIDDSVVYLSMRNAYWRLNTDTSRKSLGSVVEQLWNIALRIEDGDLPEAERALKEAQEDLMEALKENASPEKIKELVEELRAALNKYLESLAAKEQREGKPPSTDTAQQPQDQSVSDKDLDKMLKNIEDLAKSGSKDLAQQMLAELKDILDRIQTGQAPETAEQERAEEMMKDLKEVIDDQQKLMDDTFKANREEAGPQSQQFEVSPPGQPMDFPGMGMAPLFESEDGKPRAGEGGEQALTDEGNPGGQGQGKQGKQLGGKQEGGQNSQLGERQQSLQEKLQTLIDRFRQEGGEAPEQFEDAGEAMGDAKESLGESNLDKATQDQSLALDRLKKGAEQLAQQMQEGGEQQTGQGRGNNGKDPLGRPDRSNRPDLGLSVKVPDEIDIQRAREVLDELRRRLGDPSRPNLELDYLERLIKPF